MKLMLFVYHSRTGHSSSHSKCQCNNLVFEHRVFVCCVGTISLHVGFKHGPVNGHISCHKNLTAWSSAAIDQLPFFAQAQNTLFSCHFRVTCQTLETHPTCKGTHSKYHPSSLTSSGDKLRFHPIPNVEQKTLRGKLTKIRATLFRPENFWPRVWSSMLELSKQ